MSLKELLPYKGLLLSVVPSVNLPICSFIEMRTTVREDNTCALTLANQEPGQMTPQSKHYGVKYHWFCSHLKSNNIQIVKIDTIEQHADMLIKLLRTHKFAENRKHLMGWISIADSNNNDEQVHSKGSVEKLGERLQKS
jgi:hypothetical protein